MTIPGKITLVFEQAVALNSYWLQDMIAPYIALERYSPEKTYDKKSTVFYTQYGTSVTTVQQQFIDNGYKIAYDNLTEAMTNDKLRYIIQHPDWFRFNESLSYVYHGHDTYRPTKNYKHLALMPLRLQKPERDLVVQKLQPWLDDFVWSYVAKGRQLPNDGDMSDWSTQRQFNPEWYDDTCFSFVSETSMTLIHARVLISEKTYKPIAFQHPFVILGPKGILKALKDQGFETFENLFDESYDTCPVWTERLNCLVDNVKHFVKQPYDAVTQQKIDHNHAHFFNTQLVSKQIMDEIIFPLLNYAET
jgi:hypothetical protein